MREPVTREELLSGSGLVSKMAFIFSTSTDQTVEVVSTVDGRARVMLDGGIMRGSDIVKAMILGADAVGIGRLQGLAYAAAGQAGVVRMLELLENEVETVLGLLGVKSYAELEPAHLYRETETVKPPHPLSAFPLLDEGY